MSNTKNITTHLKGHRISNELSHVHHLKRGVKYWNNWRPNKESFLPILWRGRFKDMDLSGALLNNADFSSADLRNVRLCGSDLYQAEFYNCDLRKADLSGCDLRGAKFHGANLAGANLEGSRLYRADFIETKLDDAKLSKALCHLTAFSRVDLSKSQGLNEVVHLGPSSIDISTLFYLEPPYPEKFLIGVGVPETSLTDLLQIVDSKTTTSAYSCFISYSHKDNEFATTLYRRLTKENIRVWYAPEEMKGGQKIHEQIDIAIGRHDRLLIVLSENSMSSSWVETEIRKARLREVNEDRQVLFPIRLCNYTDIEAWKLFDGSIGIDLAAEVRSYYIPDFSDWKTDKKFDKTVKRLISELKEPRVEG